MTEGTLQPRSGPEIALRDGLTIGRAADADLCIEDDSVSREHAVVRRGQAAWTISDCGSRNGTLLNGTRIPMFVDCPLRDGDRLEFGAVPATVRLPARETADETKAISLSSLRGAASADGDALSPYQLQVVRCLAEPWVHGKEPASNAEIASALGTPHAVDAIKAALRRAYVKTGLAELPTHTKRRELCRVAQDRRWL